MLLKISHEEGTFLALPIFSVYPFVPDTRNMITWTTDGFYDLVGTPSSHRFVANKTMGPISGAGGFRRKPTRLPFPLWPAIRRPGTRSLFPSSSSSLEPEKTITETCLGSRLAEWINQRVHGSVKKRGRKRNRREERERERERVGAWRPCGPGRKGVSFRREERKGLGCQGL